MTPEERGGYVMLLCHAWLSDEPGTLPNDDAVLASLSGLDDRWATCREGIARAFVVTAASWTQERMKAEREQQTAYQRNASRAGIKSMMRRDANERRALASYASRKRWHPNDISNVIPTHAYTASAFASSSANLSPPTPSQNPPAPRDPVGSPDGENFSKPNGKHPTPSEGESKPQDPDDLSSGEFFDRFFWPAYPRKVGRMAARKAWDRVVGRGDVPGGEKRANAICDALRAIVGSEWEAREEKFIPHAATWLSQHRWEDS